MEWNILNKETLKNLENTVFRILVFDPTHDEDYSYDIVSYLKDIFGTNDNCWHSYLNTKNKYEYSDTEMLHIFTHYQIIKPPSAHNKLNKITIKEWNIEGKSPEKILQTIDIKKLGKILKK